MLVLRSALFSTLLWLGVVVYAPLLLLLFFLPFPQRYRLIAQFPRYHNWLLKTLCGLDFRVEGREHLPRGAFIILSKHQSTWETFALATIFPPYVYVLKRELMWIPLFGWAVALLRPIAIDRGSGKHAMEQVIAQGRARLQAGLCVLIFPEGTRVPVGEQRRFKMGGAVLAAETGYPVVPVAHNAGRFWPRRALIKRPGTIRVIIGRAVDSRGKSPAEINLLAQGWIESQVVKL